MSRKKLVDSLINRKDKFLSGENIEPPKINNDKPAVDVPKAYLRKMIGIDKDVLVQRIFLLSVENEILQREVDTLKSKLKEADEKD